MNDNVYTKLAKHLNDLPGGFPQTENGVELRILKRLFSSQQARIAPYLRLIPEETSVIAQRADIPEAEVASRLQNMAKKGLVFSIECGERTPKYMAAQYVIGIWEYQVKNLTPGLIQDMEEYKQILFNYDKWKTMPQLRTIPVGRSIEVDVVVLPYEHAEKLIENQKKIVVAPCICRREKRIIGKECKKPEESCLSFGVTADYYNRNGLGRRIDKKEALSILKEADKSGLVIQPGNTQKISIMCCCCGCCCAVLTIFEMPSQSGKYGFYTFFRCSRTIGVYQLRNLFGTLPDGCDNDC